ncbi:MAG: LysM peptidoglycan-binding domain-containing protein [Chryseolinea sp.]
MIHELILAGAAFFHPQTPFDSTGIETINGKVFVLHKVGEKETLYGISKRYGTTVDIILQYNPTADGGLEIGQILKVPYTPRPKSQPVTGGGFIHEVTAKETMFSIAKAYNVSVDELRQWNNLSSNELSIGQELTIKKRNTVSSSTVQTSTITPTSNQKGTHTVSAKETLFSITQKYGITIQQLKQWNNLEGNDLSIGQVLVVSQTEQSVVSTPKEIEPVKTEPIKNVTTSQTTQPPKENPITTIRISESVKNADELVENGVAELIEGTDGNRKYLALHRTAPVGTILKVKNEMNNREVFVRVMGKLPDTALTEKVIIRISKSAYDRLGAIDPRFRVEVTYYK